MKTSATISSILSGVPVGDAVSELLEVGPVGLYVGYKVLKHRKELPDRVRKAMHLARASYDGAKVVKARYDIEKAEDEKRQKKRADEAVAEAIIEHVLLAPNP